VTTVLLAAGDAGPRLARHLAGRHDVHALLAPPGSLREHVEAVDVLVLDAGAGPATAALRRLDDAIRPPATVLLSDDPSVGLTRAALGAGVRAVLPRGSTVRQIAAAIDAVVAGLVIVHPSALPALRPAPARSASTADARQPLTPREIEVLGMIAEGLGNKEIAARLGLSGHTVKFHIAAILAKLGAGSRTEAVTIGLRHGLILI